MMWNFKTFALVVQPISGEENMNTNNVVIILIKKNITKKNNNILELMEAGINGK